MRYLDDHFVEGGGSPLTITVVDEPGAGGANHVYHVTHPFTGQYLSNISFQNGPIKEVGLNGTTHEALLTIVADRLRSFQAGPYSSRENAIALTHVENALMWLLERTRRRVRRGVEGTNQK